jgi:hypothetical protein
MTAQRSWPLVLEVASLGCLGLLILVLWIPVVRHYYVPKLAISDDVINNARVSPSDELLEELASFRFFDRAASRESVIGMAEKLLQGIVAATPDQPGMRIRRPFDPADLDLPGLQLFLASFGVPRTFLEAYAATGREEFFEAARSFIAAWVRYETDAWFPIGLTWNDHAVAERVLVISEFWKFYRRHRSYRIDVARDVIQLAVRHAVLLSRSSHFTAATNHGVMQNLALMHFSLTFPSVPGVERYKKVAVERLTDQLEFYINTEGVTLEHSPGYHRLGLEFLSKAMRYLALLNIEPPPMWLDKYRKAQEFYAQLRLPDGRLPLFGDTVARQDELGPLLADLDSDGRARGLKYRDAWAPVGAASIYPVAGYAAWWYGLEHWPDAKALAQTVVSWSYFPGHAHKHADEMSLWVWAGGQTWWSNVGYWPYGDRNRAKAISWSASNAPHLANERRSAPRQSSLRASGSSDELAFIDLERTGRDGHVIRRQIVWEKPAQWVVVDCVIAREGRSRAVWTSAPDIRMEEGPLSGSFTLHGTDDNVFLDVLFFGTDGTTTQAVRGSVTPFAGWGVEESQIRPAPSFVVEWPATGGCAVAAWSLRRAREQAAGIKGRPSFIRMQADEEWKVLLPTRSGNIAVERTADTIATVQKSRSTETTKTLELRRAPDYRKEYESIRHHRFAATHKYPKFREHYRHRINLTWLLIGAFVVQEGMFHYVKRRHAGRYAAARWVTLCLWLAVGGLLAGYLPTLVDLYARNPVFRLGP